MSPDYSRLRNVTGRRILAALLMDGFVFDRQSGSHRHYMHPDGRRVTLSYHKLSDTFRLKTLQAIIRQAKWGDDDLKRLELQ